MDFSRSSFIFIFNMPLFLNEITISYFQVCYFIQNIAIPFNDLNEGHSEWHKGIISDS
jgi:hypothetical protein